MALTGHGLSHSPYLIKTAEDFFTHSQYIKTDYSSNVPTSFKLENDIDMTGYTMETIRGVSCVILNGGGKSIYNLTIKGVGLYENLYGASTVININFNNVTLDIEGESGYIGVVNSSFLTHVVNNSGSKNGNKNIQVTGKVIGKPVGKTYITSISGDATKLENSVSYLDYQVDTDDSNTVIFSGMSYESFTTAPFRSVKYNNIFLGKIPEGKTLDAVIGGNIPSPDTLFVNNLYDPSNVTLIRNKATRVSEPLTVPVTQEYLTSKNLNDFSLTENGDIYLTIFGSDSLKPYVKPVNIGNFTVQSFAEQIESSSVAELIEYIKVLINVISEVVSVKSQSHKTLSKAIESHTGALNSNFNKMLGLNPSSHLDPLESVTERQAKSTKNSQTYMGNIQAYMISNEIKRLLIELKMEVGSISSEIKSTTKIKNKVVTNSLNNISTNINTIARVKNMISNSYVGNIDTSSIEERIKFINSQALLSPFEANVFKGKYARVENFAQALSTHIAEQNKKKTSYPTSTITEVSGSSYAIKKLLKSVLSDLDIITAETLIETRFFLEKWVKVQSQMKQHKTKLDYANWGV